MVQASKRIAAGNHRDCLDIDGLFLLPGLKCLVRLLKALYETLRLLCIRPLKVPLKALREL